MKKITLLCLLLGAFIGLQTHAQTLNQPAGWPNTDWTVTGTYNTAANAFEADPTLTPNFAFDDDDAGGASDDSIAAESPVIDLTPAFTAGETWIRVTVDYAYNYIDDFLEFQYYDADAATWVSWEGMILPENSGSMDNFCSSAKTEHITEVLNVSAFTPTQLSGFRYRIFYDDSPTGGAGWEWGFCFDAPTITSEVPPTCPQPTALSVTGILGESAILGWTETGSATIWDIEVVPAGSTPSGNPTDAGVTANPFTVTGLSGLTEYEFYVRADCGSGDFSNWSEPFAFTTDCTTFVPYYVEDFATFVPDCWEEAGSGTPTTGPSNIGAGDWLADEFLNTGTNMAVNINMYGSSKEEWLISPSIDISGGTYELLYTAAITDWNNSDMPEGNGMGSDDEVQVLISEDNGATWTNLKTYNQADFPSNTGDIEIINLGTYTGIVKFAIWASEGTVNDIEDYDFFIDDFIVRIPPTCPQPTNLSATSVTSSSALLSWTDNAGVSLWDIEIVSVGDDPTGNPTHAGVTSNPYNVTTGLDPATDYKYYVRADCGGGDTSYWSGPYAFTTECATFTLPFVETFDQEDIVPNCWTESGPTTWRYDLDADYAALNVLDHTPGGGTFYAWMDGSNNTDGEASTLTSPPVDISGLTEPGLEFFLFSDNTNDSAINIVDVDFYDGATWHNVLHLDTLLGDDWTQFLFGLDGYTITGPVQVRFTVTGNDNGGSAFNNDILLDDVTFRNASCFPPIVNYTVVSDCLNAPQFFVEANVTDMGSATDLDIADDQGSAVQTVTTTGVYTFGPYPVLTPVQLTTTNNQDNTCASTSAVLTLENCTENLVDCAVGPVNTVFCYQNNEIIEFSYTSSDGSPLNLIFNAGQVENNWDEVYILDSDGTTVLNPGMEFGPNDDGELTGWTFQSTGDTIIVRVTPDGSNSCANPFSSLDSIDLTVSCATCINPQVTYTVVSDCLNAPQFFVDVDLTDLGSATDMDISDNQGSPVQTVSAPGIYTFGPYPVLTPVEIAVSNNQDVNCVNTSGILTLEFCTENLVDCAVGPVNTVFCYQSNEIIEFSYTSSTGIPLNLVFNSGQVENNWDEIYILDSDGVTELNPGLYFGPNGDGELAGWTFQSTGDTIIVRVEPDGSVDCPSSANIDPIDLTVSCATCINPQADYDVVSDCDSGINQFFVEVDITSLGDATSLTLADNQASPTQSATTTGILTFGPYPNGTDVVFTISNDQDVNCTITSTSMTQEFCPPTNDECVDATVAVVNDDKFCVQTTQVVLPGATSSSAPGSCGGFGSTSVDVWFQFTAISTTQMITLIDPPADARHAIYEGNCDDGTLNEIFCWEEFGDAFDSQSITAANLTIGETYLVRVSGDSNSSSAFELCITTPTYGENTDCANIEPFCAPTDSSGNPEPLIFPSGYYYMQDYIAPVGPDYDCIGIERNPAWYYLQVDQDGDLEFLIEQNTAFDANGVAIGEGLDVDFIVWGPYNSLEECDNLTAPFVVDCSYSAAPIEDMIINGALEGEIYIVMITNYEQNPGYISLQQTNFGETGAGTTDCTILDETIFACEGNDVILTSQFVDAIAYVWYEYDADTDTFIQITTEPEMDSITVTEDGIYKCVSYDNIGVATEEIFNVFFSPSPEVDLGPDASLCGIPSIDLDGTIANPADFGTVTYQWYDENGPIPSEDQPTYTVTVPGTYSIEVTGTILNEDGVETDFVCTTIDEIVITDSDFTVDLGNDIGLCDEASYTIDPIITNGDETDASYLWSTGETTPTITVTESNIYTVVVTIDNCSSPVESVEVIFGDSPMVDLGPDVNLCGVASIDLDGTVGNASEYGTLTYQWYDQDGTIAGADGPTYTVTVPGTYSVEITGTLLNSAGVETQFTCVGTDEIVVSSSNFTVDLGGNQVLCDVDSYTIDPTINGEDESGATYLWNTGETTPTITVSDDGTYSVVVSINGCDAPETSVEITFNERPIVDLGEDVNTCDFPVVLTAAAEGSSIGLSFEWSMDGTVLSGETNSSLSVNEYGDYSVKVSIEGADCPSEVVSVSVGPCDLPQGISPNGDGLNDRFDLTALKVEGIEIFNRNGRSVYGKSGGYTDEWYGQTDEGDDLLTGTYYYVIKLKDGETFKGKQVLTGWVYINQQIN